MKLTIFSHGQQFGPFKIEEIKHHLEVGTFMETDLGWHPGLANWLPLRDLPFLKSAVSSEVQPMPARVPERSEPVQPPLNSVGTTLSALAVISLILSLLSFVITPLPALICGWLAKSRIRRNPRLGGMELARSGIWIAWFFLALFLMLYLLAYLF